MARNTNENKKIDLRVIKTQKLLCSALFTLLQENPIESITVQEICEKAMVNRMTFYKHYSDKYDLFGDCMANIQREIFERVEKTCSLEKTPALYCETLVKQIVEFCDANRTILKKLTLQENVIATSILYHSMQENMEKLIKKLAEGKTLYLPVEYSAAFLTGGCVRMIMHWVAHREEYSKEQLFADLTPFLENYVKVDVLFRN